MKILITNIKELLQVRESQVDLVAGNAMKELPKLENAYVLIENDAIADYGSMEHCPHISADQVSNGAEQIAGNGRYGQNSITNLDRQSHPYRVRRKQRARVCRPY